jgi:hypothetical protein
LTSGFTRKLLSLIVVVAGVTAAQSAQRERSVQGVPPGLIAEPIKPTPAQSAAPRKDIPAIAKAANGSIVSIVMSDKNDKPIAQGSGFLVGKDGVIVTNYHVISEGSSAIVKFPDGAFYAVDGVVAFDKARDVAVIKAHGQNFRTLTLGNSGQVKVGEEVVAIGNPLSLESTVSNGIISGIRTVEERGGQFIQTTAPISPGSSGGPLFNMAGEVIGINTLYLKGGENLNFAIPINDAKRLLQVKSSKIQPLPNEPDPDPVKAQKHDESNAETLPTLDQKTACNALARQAYDTHMASDPIYHDKMSDVSATYSSHLDVRSATCFVILFETVRWNLKLANGAPYVTINRGIYVSDAIEGTKYGQFNQGFKPGDEIKTEELPSVGFVVPLDGDYRNAIAITPDKNETGTAWFRVALLKLLGIHL